MMTWLVFIGSNPLYHGRRRSHRSLRQSLCATDAACSRHDDGDDGWRLRLAECVWNVEFRRPSVEPKFPVTALGLCPFFGSVARYSFGVADHTATQTGRGFKCFASTCVNTPVMLVSRLEVCLESAEGSAPATNAPCTTPKPVNFDR